MPKSKRSKVVHLSQVDKKGREHKDKLFDNVRVAANEYQRCFVFSLDNSRNSYLKNVRHELTDSLIYFGKTKVMARALGSTPEEEQADGIHKLTRHLHGQVGLIFTNREASDVLSYLETIQEADFARAGTIATRDFIIAPGVVYSTGGEVPAEHDVLMEHTIEPELRRLGVPTRMVKGRIVLGSDEGEAAEDEISKNGYVVCREGQVLDSRQTRLLKLFSIPISQFRVRVLAYWSAETSEVTEVRPDAMNEDADDSEHD